MNAITAVFNADSTPFQGEMAKMVAMAQTAGKNIENTMFNPGGASSSEKYVAAFKQLLKAQDAAAIRARIAPAVNPIFGDAMPSEATKRAVLKQELLLRKAIRDNQSKIPNIIFQDTPEEAARKLMPSGQAAAGGFLKGFLERLQGHGSGGMAQLIHVFRASFDSLASGMSPWRVLLQQGPQALQAITVMSSTLIAKFAAVGGAFAILAAGIGVGLWRTKKMIEELSGLQLPDFNYKFMPKVDQIEEAWRKIGKAIEEAREHYDGVAESAQRAMEVSKMEFALRRAQLEHAGKGPTSPEMLALNKEERASQINQLSLEKLRLFRESEEYAGKASAIKVGEKDKESETERVLKEGRDAAMKQAEEAKKIIEFYGNATEKPGASGNTAQGIYALPSGKARTLSESEQEKLRRAQELVGRANAFDKQYRDYIQGAPQRERDRAERDRLTNQGAKSGAAAVALEKQIQQLQATSKIQDEIDKLSGRPKNFRGNLTSLQQVGAFISPGVSLIDEARKHTHLLTQINNKLGRDGGGVNVMPPLSHVRY